MIDYAERYRLKREEWSKADGEARMLEEMRKVVLGEIKQRSDLKTESAKETEAYASPIYRKHVAKMVEARTIANVILGEWKAMELAMEIWRTKESTKRAEMQMGGHG